VSARLLRGVLAAAGTLLVLAAPAAAHKGNPNFLTEVNAVTPATDGVTLEVLNRDDQLLLHNTSGKDVVIEGYEHEPYARVLGDGSVQVNTNSPAYYLNDDRFTENVTVPKGIEASDPPKWKSLDKTGRFQWHDHRMHWMAHTRPPQVTDPDKRTKVEDWSVPISIGGSRGEIAGTLFWTPRPGGSMPVGAIAGGAGLVVLLLIGVTVVRRRRTSADLGGPGPEAAPAREAW